MSGAGADFYLGQGKGAGWIGSINCDGYPWDPGVPRYLLEAGTETEYRDAVVRFLKQREKDEEGAYVQVTDVRIKARDDSWPWPYTDSGDTEFSYTFFAGAVQCSRYGERWVEAVRVEERPVFPRMK